MLTSEGVDAGWKTVPQKPANPRLRFYFKAQELCLLFFLDWGLGRLLLRFLLCWRFRRRSWSWLRWGCSGKKKHLVCKLWNYSGSQKYLDTRVNLKAYIQHMNFIYLFMTLKIYTKGGICKQMMLFSNFVLLLIIFIYGF